MLGAGTIRADGLHLVYDRAGNGPRSSCSTAPRAMHASGCAQIAGLSDDFTVIAWDEPGAGRSSDLPADAGLGRYATALAALIESLDAPAHVCGLSWGGTVALELCRPLAVGRT
jgi:pimeloyl-ACP methyl ester carboxylesterase